MNFNKIYINNYQNKLNLIEHRVKLLLIKQRRLI